ncbi:MAG: hypothetical protein ACI81L_002082, partial [Verrucomicrobiales bacterium]
MGSFEGIARTDNSPIGTQIAFVNAHSATKEAVDVLPIRAWRERRQGLNYSAVATRPLAYSSLPKEVLVFVFTVILGIVLGGMFLIMSEGKVTGKMEDLRENLGLSDQIWKIDGATGMLGGIGVLVGLIDGLAIIGVLAGIGLAIQTALALGFHVRRHDTP